MLVFARAHSENVATEARDDAPPTESEQQQQQLSWFGFHVDADSGKVTLSLVDEAIEYIATICREQGPFDGVFGFSQGGTIASLTLQRQRTCSDERVRGRCCRHECP